MNETGRDALEKLSKFLDSLPLSRDQGILLHVVFKMGPYGTIDMLTKNCKAHVCSGKSLAYWSNCYNSCVELGFLQLYTQPYYGFASHEGYLWPCLSEASVSSPIIDFTFKGITLYQIIQHQIDVILSSSDDEDEPYIQSIFRNCGRKNEDGDGSEGDLEV